MPRSSSARPNPIGLDVRAREAIAPVAPSGITLVRIGEGEFVHLWDPDMAIVVQGQVVGKGIHLCQSGKNAGVKGGSGATTRPRISHEARFVTCYRCARIASLNQNRYGALLRPRGAG